MELLEVKAQIKKLREFKGYTQKQMANFLGIGERTYQDIESKREKDISYTQLKSIAEKLEMTLSHLIGFDDKIVFNNCKTEGNNSANCVYYTFADAEKIFEKLLVEKDERIMSLEKQIEKLLEKL